jgi:hypothetical protein
MKEANTYFQGNSIVGITIASNSFTTGMNIDEISCSRSLNPTWCVTAWRAGMLSRLPVSEHNRIFSGNYSFPNGRPGTARLGTTRSDPRACRVVPDSAAVPSVRHGHGTMDSIACRAGPFVTAARSCSCRPRHGSSICKLHLFQ